MRQNMHEDKIAIFGSPEKRWAIVLCTMNRNSHICMMLQQKQLHTR